MDIVHAFRRNVIVPVFLQDHLLRKPQVLGHPELHRESFIAIKIIPDKASPELGQNDG